MTDSSTSRGQGKPSDHDQGYKLLFSHARMVEQLLRGFIGEDWAERLDFSTLEKVGASFVSDDLRERHDDVIWKLRWKGEEDHWFWLYLVLEFQSRPDPFMPVRLLAYLGLLLQELIRQGKLKAGDRLPAVLPVVLYRGEERWRVPLDLAELFVPVPAGLNRYLPQLRYLLLDEARLDLDRPELRENLAAVLFRLETSELDETVSLVEDLAGLVPAEEKPLRRAFSIWLARVFRRFSPGVTIPETIDLETAPMLEERIRQWQEKQRQEGHREGRREGRQEGRQEGLQEGLQKGRQDAMQKLVLDLLNLRFGPLPQAVRRRVKEITSPTELRRLNKQILTAKSLDEMGLT